MSDEREYSESKIIKKSKKFLVEVPSGIVANTKSFLNCKEDNTRKQSIKSISRKSLHEFERRKFKFFPKVEHTKSRLLSIKKAELEYKSYGVALPTVSPIENNLKLMKSFESLKIKSMKSFEVKKTKSESLSKSYSDEKKRNEIYKIIKDNATEKFKVKIVEKSNDDSSSDHKLDEKFDSKVGHAKGRISSKSIKPKLPPKDSSDKKSPLKSEVKKIHSKIEEPSKKTAIEEMFNIGITTFTEDDEVYCRKIPKYKEVKHYIKGEVLGRGKFGVVREFVDKSTLKRYAGKILTKRQIMRNHLGTQVAKELSVMFHLNHPNILRAYDLFQNEKKLYMFIELCWGELAEFMQHYKTLPKCQSKSYFIQILEGLDYIHSRGIIHRDIKPENLLLNNSHVIKLADFGCIQEIDFFADNDYVSGNDGTPLYHPPELFEEKVMEYSGSKIDIWAAGGILYQMLTGSPAFVDGPGDMADVVIKRIKTVNPNYEVPIIKNDVLLLNLFNRIFEKDFTQRATICEIRNNSWVKNRCASNSLSHFRPYPTANQRGDSYRSITVITRIHEKYNPSQDNKLYVDFKTFELSKQIRPLIRGTRIETKKNTRKNNSKTFL